MNAIDIAIQRVINSIPPAVLDRAFLSPYQQQFHGLPFSLDSIIRDKVIGQRVWSDTSLLGATTMVLPLMSLTPTQPDAYTYIYHVPKELTNGRTIVSALNAIYYLAQGWAAYGGLSGPSNAYTTMRENSATLQAAKALMSVNTEIAMISTANCDIIGENVVLVNDPSGLILQGGIRAMLAHDEDFSTLKPTIFRHFAKLVLLATQAWIYNNTVVEMDENELRNGRALGAIKRIIEKYETADTEYEEYLATSWSRAARLNDTISTQNRIRGMFGFAR